MSAPLLVELLCEELPPKALLRLGEAFAKGVRDGLAKRGLVEEPADALVFATPRRGVWFTGVTSSERLSVVLLRFAIG